MMEFMRVVAAPVSRPDCLFVFVSHPLTALGFIDAVKIVVSVNILIFSFNIWSLPKDILIGISLGLLKDMLPFLVPSTYDGEFAPLWRRCFDRLEAFA